MSKIKFLIILTVTAAMSVGAASSVNAGGYYGGGYYPPPYYGPRYDAYSDYGYYGYDYAPFTWPFFWGPPDDYCHQRVRIYDNWGGWVWGQRIVC